MSVVGWLNLFSRQMTRLSFGHFQSSAKPLLLSATHVSKSQPFDLLRQPIAGSFSTAHQDRVPLQLHENSDDISKAPAVKTAINDQLRSGKAGRLFAVVHVAGKQRKVTTEDIIVLDKPIAAEIGTRIRLNKVLLVGGRDFSLVGRPVLGANQVRVEATVLEKTLSHTKIMFWYHKRRDHRVFRLRKDSLTMLRINDISVAGVD